MVNILLVDDRPYGLMAMEAVLKCPDYNLVMANSGQEAIAALYDHDFAVILMDVQMPVMDGFETAKLIRQFAPARETPILFITAINKDSHHISRGYESGAIDYLFKPVDPVVLKCKVKLFVELYQARQSLKKMNVELEARVAERTHELIQTNKELEQFAYIASHDLQEPLRKIIIFSDLLKSGYGNAMDPAAVDTLDRMRKAGLRMKTVIEDLLLFSKINSKELTFEDLSLKQVIGEILVDLDVKIQQRRVLIEVAEMPIVHANKSQVQHLFQNLITNAIKFSKKDERPKIEISSEVDGDFLEVKVKDNGIGFDEKYSGQIFKLFHRLHPTHEYEGSGIGLSICQKIAQQHGGNITAKSQLGEGSVFSVTLPLAVPKLERDALPAHAGI